VYGTEPSPVPGPVLLAALAGIPLGPHSGALAVDLDTGRALLSRRAAVARIPASVEKLWTTSTALRRLGPEAQLVTRVHAAGGTLYLRGGGDPTLGPRQIGLLALRVRASGVTRVKRVVGDEALFDRRRGVPSSYFGLSPDVEPLSALTYNRNAYRGGYVRAPAQVAADALARSLRRAHVQVGGGPATIGRTPSAAPTIARVHSPPVRRLAAATNTPSDNFYAETLLKDLGALRGAGGTTAAGAGVARAAARELGLRPMILDGSGLSRRNRSSPRQVVGLLRAMDGDRDFYMSLARFGRPEGTLATRLRGSPAALRCRAKTGTLRDVSALAGYCRTMSGRTVAFAILMNSVWPPTARWLQDRMIRALVRYG
jgi:D-alanyl-D-alanine carboxypeptidase/D-alanyl-D-alanine-endopeptidase (penicillin-binding protein 4)